MRIKIIGDNNCARATRHLLRLAGFAVTEFLPADVITAAPHSGYAITIDLAPALPLTPAYEPDSSTHVSPAAVSEEASRMLRGASSPALANASAGLPAFSVDSGGMPAIAESSSFTHSITKDSSAAPAIVEGSAAARATTFADDGELEELLATASGVQAARNSRTANNGETAGMGHGSAEIARGGKILSNARSGIAEGIGNQSVENSRVANTGGNVVGEIQVTPNAEFAREAANAAAARACNIQFDSVESDLETAVLRHVTRMAKAPVIVDRPGGVVHSERELRITLPQTGDAKADESAAVAVEFGVLRGLLDLSRRPSGSEVSGADARGGVRAEKFALRGKDAAEAAIAAEAERASFAQGEKSSAKNGSRKWWIFGVAFVGVSLAGLVMPGASAGVIRGGIWVASRGSGGCGGERPQAEACATQNGATHRGAALDFTGWQKMFGAPKCANTYLEEQVCGSTSSTGFSLWGLSQCPARFVVETRRLTYALRTIPTTETLRLTYASRPIPAGATPQPVPAPEPAAFIAAEAPRIAVPAAVIPVAAVVRAAGPAAVVAAAVAAGPEPQGQFATGQGVKIFDGANTFTVDPCQAQTKSYLSINQTANTQLLAGTASKKIYICSMHVVVAAAANVALVEGTGTVCATGTAGVSGFGGATAATGWNFSANSGIVVGNGASSVGAESTAADNLCLFNSGAGQVSGGISYVVQ